jgi:hypothetical protein
MVRPLGRWVELARLALIRKEYAFLYSKLLKVPTTTFLLLLLFNAISISIIININYITALGKEWEPSVQRECTHRHGIGEEAL